MGKVNEEPCRNDERAGKDDKQSGYIESERPMLLVGRQEEVETEDSKIVSAPPYIHF